MRSALVAILLSGCAADPFAGPAMPAGFYVWNPQIRQGGDYPCPNMLVYPYFHGWNDDGTPNCTTRPLDFQFEDMDTLALP